MDIASIAAAYNGLKIGKEILSGLLDAKIEAVAKGARLELFLMPFSKNMSGRFSWSYDSSQKRSHMTYISHM